MNTPHRSRYLFLAVLLSCLGFAINPLAQIPNPAGTPRPRPAPAQQGENAAPPLPESAVSTPQQQDGQPEPQKKWAGPDDSESGTASAPPPKDRIGRIAVYSDFIREIGMDDYLTKKESLTGQKRVGIDWATQNRLAVGLTDDEWTDTYNIVLDANHRYVEWGRQFDEGFHLNDGNFQVDSTNRTPEHKASLEAIKSQGRIIVAETIIQLKRQLGEESFKKLDLYLWKQMHGGTIILHDPTEVPVPTGTGPIAKDPQ